MTANYLISIDPATLREWLACGDTVVIDVREHTEYALEHIAGAWLMPLCRLDPYQVPLNKRVVLCCASGNRSQTAARRLGLEGLAHLDGGLTAWKALGYATERKHPSRPATVGRFHALAHA